MPLIPAVRIDQRFQGGPKSAEKPERYATKILNHHIAQARACTDDRLPFLGLDVHPQNVKAIAVYRRAGFVDLVGQIAKNPDPGVDYPAMVLKLAPAAG